jgi:hypothetical protein
LSWRHSKEKSALFGAGSIRRELNGLIESEVDNGIKAEKACQEIQKKAKPVDEVILKRIMLFRESAPIFTEGKEA